VRAHRQWARFEEDVDDIIPLAFKTSKINLVETAADPDTWMGKIDHQELVDAQKEDPNLYPLFCWLEEDPSEAQLKLASRATKFYWINRNFLVIKDNLLYYKWLEDWGNKLKLIVPEKF
jgi:hypothetical protein